MKYVYPKDLAGYVQQSLSELRTSVSTVALDEKSGVKALTLAELENLLSICYQSSLMTHEGEPVSFRLIVADPLDFDGACGPPEKVQKLEFASYLPLTAAELRRLSPAARYSRSIIGIRFDSLLGPVIWGVIHTGPRWLHTSHGGRGEAPELPPKLVIKVMSAGNMEVLKGNDSLVSLSQGKFHGQSLNVFKSEWLKEYLAPVRHERLELHRQARLNSGEYWADLDPALCQVIDQYMMKRVIAAMKAFRHGGTLLLMAPEQVPTLTEPNPYLTMKYMFADRQSRERFRDLIVEVMNTLAKTSPSDGRLVGWQDYRRTDNQRIKALDEAIFEMSHLVSSLSAADGAVVLSRSFELLGFGAEIHCEGAEVTHVAKALDLEGNRLDIESVLGVGTRHRSAYRLCGQLRNTLAIVVSQEGTVQFVRWKGGQLMFWEHQGSFDFSSLN